MNFRPHAALVMVLGLLWSAIAAQAAPARYILDADRSQVAFIYSFDGQEVTGTAPVSTAEILLDPANLAASRVDVTLDLGRARGGFPFATQALRGPRMFDLRNHPRAHFRSTRIRRTETGARMEGVLTLRGVTRPVALDVALYRQRGTEPGDLDHLTLLVTGIIDRHEFGVSGYPRRVGPEVALRIVVRIDREGA